MLLLVMMHKESCYRKAEAPLENSFAFQGLVIEMAILLVMLASV